MFLDSCEHYVTAQLQHKWNRNVGSGVEVTTDGRNGSGLNLKANQGVGKTLPHKANGCMGFAMKVSQPAGGGVICQVFHVGTLLAGIFLEHDGTLSAFVNLGNSFKRIANSSKDHAEVTIKAGVWYYIEAGFTVVGSEFTPVNVEISLKVNTLTVCHENGDTGFIGKDLTLFEFTGVSMNYYEILSANIGGNTIVDDIYINEGAGFLGDIKIVALYPSADITVQWQQSAAGAAYSLVNETPPDGDSTYIYSQTANDLDLFEFQDLPVNLDVIAAVQINAYHRKDDEGTRSFKLTYGTANLDDLGEVYVSDSYRYDTCGTTTIPGGGSWTPTSVNNSRWGIRVIK